MKRAEADGAAMPANRPALSAARMAVQLGGFAIGAALLTWCIMKAIGSADLYILFQVDIFQIN